MSVKNVYELWDYNNTLEDANINLCTFIFNKAKLSTKSFYFRYWLWIRPTIFFITLTPSSTITAVDLSRKQIKFANKQRKKLKISNIKFVQGDALKINKQFHTKFDRIFSIESAFNRPLLFNHVNHLLQDDGIFVISDIMLSNTYRLIHHDYFYVYFLIFYLFRILI